MRDFDAGPAGRPALGRQRALAEAPRDVTRLTNGVAGRVAAVAVDAIVIEALVIARASMAADPLSRAFSRCEFAERLRRTIGIAVAAVWAHRAHAVAEHVRRT